MSYVHKKIGTLMFTVDFFMPGENQKQTKCLLTGV